MFNNFFDKHTKYDKLHSNPKKYHAFKRVDKSYLNDFKYNLPNNNLVKLKFKPKILILSGGSIKAYAHYGALKYLEENKLLSDVKVLIGSSAGALLSAMLSIGYSLNEQISISLEENIEELYSVNFTDFLTNYGLCDGVKYIEWLKKVIKKKTNNSNITLMEAYKIRNLYLIMSTSCISTCKSVYLNYKTHPDLELWRAIYMSSCIPIAFKPMMYDNKCYVDGSLFDNIPTKYVSNKLEYTLAIYIKPPRDNYDIDSFTTFIKRLLYSPLVNNSNNNCKNLKYLIELKVKFQKKKDNKTFNIFKISNSEKKELIYFGYNATKEYFSTNQK